ncbi:MAG: alpha/beta hydrolase [Chloroflexi bacterium]|nr:alpha/beta hydrolase [Chloroflexota bacterium]
MEIIMIILATILSGLSLVMGIMFFIRSGPPPGFFVMFAKVIASALAPYWAIIGAVGAVLGWISQAFWAIPMGIVGAGLMIWYIWQCTRDHGGFENAFGTDWSDQILPEQAMRMVQKRWTWFLKMKASPEPSWERDVAFWTIPDTERELLCDIWRPANGNVSGLTYIYFHGSAWWMGDKDMLTRPFFKHLVAQGHTVMDVAYRLCPEVSIYGMIGDVKRSIAWIKANATRYGVDPEKIVLGGGSAGCHLALLAAYTPEHPELTPKDIKDVDLSVRGVISYYGPTDLLAEYKHYMWKEFYSQEPPLPTGKKLDPKITMQYTGRLDILLGGHPQDVSDVYQLASPVNHVHPGCPPTLLIQGDHDLLVPVDDTCELYTKLVESGVPAINVVFPSTDHAFDLLLPQINPPAQSALYDVDRFLALLLNKD